MLAINLPEGGKVADALSSLGGKLRPAQLLKLLPVLPYVGRMDALAGELSFAAVRGKVICIDDVERAPNSLPVADVLGLANYLKEERQCRVLLISNRDKFNEAGKAGLKLYLEKVVDEWIDLAPTIEEAAAVAFAPGTSQALVRLRERVGQLPLRGDFRRATAASSSR